jgi:hypothetical protein
MTATAQRRPVEQETAAEHCRNALQILKQPDEAIDDLDLAAVRDRLERAIAAIDVENDDPIARRLLQAKEAERLELVNEVRELREQLSAFQFKRAGIHIVWDDDTGAETFIVFRQFRTEEGRFARSEWAKAVELADKFRQDAIIEAVKATPINKPLRRELAARGD